jgi:hypothetical protein
MLATTATVHCQTDCRLYGVLRWPYRQLKGIEKSIGDIQQSMRCVLLTNTAVSIKSSHSLCYDVQHNGTALLRCAS